MKYSENPDKQYHIQVGEGDVGSAVPRSLHILMMRSWWLTAVSM